jgi:O-antigen/teichoic acid export membrane protein
VESYLKPEVDSGGGAGLAQEKPLSDRIVRNVLFGGFRSLLVAPVPFLLTPLILKKIGTGGYGTWAVFLAINGLTSLADLGLVGTLSKFVAQYHARRDYVGLNRLLNTGLAVFGALSLLLSGLLWVGTSLIVRILFHGSLISGPELAKLFRHFLAVVAANVLILLFSSVTTGLQRLDLTNVMSAVSILSAATLDAVLLFRGWGLRGLLYGQICASVLTLLGYVMLVNRLLPQIRLNPFGMNGTEAKHIFNFSLRLYFTQAAVAIHNNIEKLLLASLVGVAAAGWYDIANDVALKIRGAIGIVLSPVMPAASELGALKDEHRLVELYYRAHKYLAFVGVPVVCYVGAVSTRFVQLWIGPSFQVVALPLVILVFVNFFNLTSGPGFLILAGNGNLGPGMRSAVFGIVLNVGLSSILIYKFGFAGAVLGTSASLVIATTYFLYLFHRETGNPVGRLLRESLRPVVCSLGVLALLWVIQSPRGLSWAGLVTWGVAFGIGYMTALLFSRFFDRYEWGKVESVVPAMRYLRRVIPVA